MTEDTTLTQADFTTIDLTSVPRLDLAAARSRFLDDDEILNAFLASVLPSIQPSLEQLSHAVTKGQMDQAKSYAHSMRGAMSNAGADRLAQRLRWLESNLNVIALSESVAHLEAITRDCSEVEVLIRDYINTSLKS
jgi:HPt (histidine-containing phosphotransfer) domain-containing protein